MTAADTPARGEQESVSAHFDAAALYWQEVYDDPRLQGVIYRARQEAVLARVAEDRPADGSVLEIGCGAGLLTLALAQRGFAVEAVDVSQEMVELAARRAEVAGLAERISVRQADVLALPFESASFSLVVAVGVLPWLLQPELALQEIARVLRVGGVLILTADNRARLNTFVDPRASMLLAPLKRLRRRIRPPTGAIGATSRLHYPSHVNALVRGAGFRVGRASTVGFGPFSLWSRPLLSEPAAVAVHRRLQRLAERRVPVARGTGWHYLLSAKKVD